jgi:hypothetical protein
MARSLFQLEGSNTGGRRPNLKFKWFSLHSAVAIKGEDREGLKTLRRYASRSPVSILQYRFAFIKVAAIRLGNVQEFMPSGVSAYGKAIFSSPEQALLDSLN